MQAIQTNWNHQIMLAIYFFLSRYWVFSHLWIQIWLEPGIRGIVEKKRKEKEGGKSVSTYIKKLAQWSLPNIRLYRIQTKVQISLLSYLDQFTHRASQKHVYFYWLPLSTPLYPVLFAALLHWFLLPKSQYWFFPPLLHLLCFSQPPTWLIGKVQD